MQLHNDIQTLSGIYERAAELLDQQKVRLENLLADPGSVLTVYNYGSSKPWYDLTTAPLVWDNDIIPEFGYHKFQNVVMSVLESYLSNKIDPLIKVSLEHPKSYPSPYLISFGSWTLCVVDLMRRTYNIKPITPLNELQAMKEGTLEAIRNIEKYIQDAVQKSSNTISELTSNPYRYAFNHPELNVSERVKTLFLITFHRKALLGRATNFLKERIDTEVKYNRDYINNLENKLSDIDNLITQTQNQLTHVTELTNKITKILELSGYQEKGG